MRKPACAILDTDHRAVFYAGPRAMRRKRLSHGKLASSNGRRASFLHPVPCPRNTRQFGDRTLDSSVSSVSPAKFLHCLTKIVPAKIGPKLLGHVNLRITQL